jgi:AcrR family transcriptional regulator
MRMADAEQSRERDPRPFGQRHRTAREAVGASQRGRVLEAMVKAVAEKGYPATTIADVVAGAGVSRRTFYQQFRDKEECFLAAFDTGVEFVRSRVEEEFASLEPRDWRGHLRVLFETYLATLASEPEFTKVLHVDALAAGAQARARWGETLERSVARYRSLHEIARAEDPRVPAVSDEMLLVLAGSLPEVVREYVRMGRLARLPELAPGLATLATAIVSGALVARPADGARRMRAEKRRAGGRGSAGR